MSERIRRAIRPLLLLLIPTTFLAGCDDQGLISPSPELEEDLFARYVALGNSITAGFQSEGINEETQMESYAALLAGQMGTRYDAPLLNLPGCPAPLVNPITRERVGGATPADCGLRATPVPRFLNNVAVPGAAALDLTANLGPGTSANPLTTLFLGGRTQVEAALDADPTFVSVWMGNNDVLGAAILGIVTEDNVTSVSSFQSRVVRALDALEAGGVQGGVLIGVADVTLIPHLTPGVAFWSAAQQGLLPPTFQVAPTCAPAAQGGVGESTLVPFGFGFGDLFLRAQVGLPVALNCATAPRVLSPQEIGILTQAVTGYNEVLAAQAQARGWAFFDPNPTFRELREDGLIPFFPDLLNPTALFGPIFSLDGVHPSAAAHRLVTNELIRVINGVYGTSLTPLDMPELVAVSGS